MKILVALLVLLTITVSQGFPGSQHVTKNGLQRFVRGIKDWNIFSKATTPASITPTTIKQMPNNIEIGQCEEDDKIIYIDDTRLEANNSTLSGVIEIHIDSPYYITCTRVFDQMPVGTGAIPSYHSGGFGEKFIFVIVQGQYGNGIHFKIIVRGNLKKSEEENKLKGSS